MNINWGDIAQTLGTAIVAGAAAGGAFSELLKKSLDARFARTLAKYQSDLTAQVHMQNRVFDRSDQQRADAVQRLSTLILEFRWDVIDFRPKSPWMNPADEDPLTSAFMWSTGLQQRAKAVLQAAHESTLLTPERLNFAITGWYVLSNQMAIDLMQEFFNVLQPKEGKTLTDKEERRQQIVAAKDAFMTREPATNWASVTKAVLSDLRGLFESVGRPDEIRALFAAAPGQTPDSDARYLQQYKPADTQP